MADNELVIILRMETGPADQAEAAYHARARRRAKETEEENKKLDKERERSVRENIAYRIRVHKEADAQVLKSQKELAAQQLALEKERERSVRENIAYRIRAHKEAAAAEARAAKEAAVASGNAAKDAAMIAKEAEIEKARAAKETAAQQKALDRERERSVRENIAYRIRSSKEQAAEERRASRESADSAKKTLQERLQWHKDITKVVRDDASEVLSVAHAYTAMRLAAEIGQGVRAVMVSIGQSTKEARDYTRELVDEMEKMREATAEIIAMRGQQPSAGGAGEIAAAAEAAHVETGEYTNFMKGLTAEAQRHVPPEGVAPEKQPLYRLKDTEQMTRLGKEAVEIAVAQGIDPKAASQLLGVAISTAKRGPDGKVQDAQVMDNYSKLLKSAQSARGETSPLLPQFAEFAAEFVGEGADYKDVMDAAVVFRTAATANPKKAFTLATALGRGMRQIRQKERKAEELEITPEMNFEQAMAQAVKKIPEIAQQENVPEETVAARYFNEEREFRAYKAFVEKGIKEKEFETSRAEIAGTGRGFGTGIREKYEKSYRGKMKTTLAGTDRAKIERATGYQELRQVEREAYMEMIASGELEDSESIMNALITKDAEQFGQGNRQEQEIRRKAISKITSRLSKTREGTEALRPFTAAQTTDTGIGTLAKRAIHDIGGYPDKPGDLLGTDTSVSVLKDLANTAKNIEKSNQDMKDRAKLSANQMAVALMGSPYIITR